MVLRSEIELTINQKIIKDLGFLDNETLLKTSSKNKNQYPLGCCICRKKKDSRFRPIDLKILYFFSRFIRENNSKFSFLICSRCFLIYSKLNPDLEDKFKYTKDEISNEQSTSKKNKLHEKSFAQYTEENPAKKNKDDDILTHELVFGDGKKK